MPLLAMTTRSKGRDASPRRGLSSPGARRKASRIQRLSWVRTTALPTFLVIVKPSRLSSPCVGRNWRMRRLPWIRGAWPWIRKKSRRSRTRHDGGSASGRRRGVIGASALGGEPVITSWASRPSGACGPSYGVPTGPCDRRGSPCARGTRGCSSAYDCGVDTCAWSPEVSQKEGAMNHPDPKSVNRIFRPGDAAGPSYTLSTR